MRSFVRVLALAWLATTAGARPDGLAQAVSAAARGELRDAYRAAEGETDPVRRSQALLHVLHHAGDLGGAYRAGRAGLESAPSDLWLLERTAYLALSLRAAADARELVERFERALAASELEGQQREDWARALAEHRREARNLLELDAATRSAALRAQVVVGAAGLITLWLLTRLGGRSIPTEAG